MPATAIHSTPYSGTWYPERAIELNDLLDRLWQESTERTGRYLLSGGRAFLVPHAGLIYSGRVAAAVYRSLEQDRPERVIVAGFAHRGAPAGVLIPQIDSYQTPLGVVRIDRQMAATLNSEPPFRSAPEEALCDHSVEIQLPLLQRALPEAKILPLYVSRLTAAERLRAAEALAGLLGPGTVLVASSDLTHYGASFGFQPFPADWTVGERLRRLDYEVLEAAGSLHSQLFLDTLRETSATVCGYEPVSLMLETVRLLEGDEEIFQEILDYETSGEITRDYRHSVSYGAAGYFPHRCFELSAGDAAVLLDLARRALEHYQRTGSRDLPEFAPTGRAALTRRAALFVTLHREGKLRGCLGNTAPTVPLEVAVPQMTLASALEDPRFDPLSPSEANIDLEISILTPMKRILNLDQFRVGQHGALLRYKGRQGLLLPQVATERNWTAEQFLRALGVKAGAGEHACWDSTARISVFRAQVIRGDP